jgi:hypothetical protein
MNEDPVCELHNDGEDVFVLVDGVKIARRGRPDTAQAMTWWYSRRAGSCATYRAGTQSRFGTKARGFIDPSASAIPTRAFSSVVSNKNSLDIVAKQSRRNKVLPGELFGKGGWRLL